MRSSAAYAGATGTPDVVAIPFAEDGCFELIQCARLFRDAMSVARRSGAAALPAVRAHEAAKGEVSEEHADRGSDEDSGVRERMGKRWPQFRAETPQGAAAGEGEEAEEDAHDLQPEDGGEADGRLNRRGVKAANALAQALRMSGRGDCALRGRACAHSTRRRRGSRALRCGDRAWRRSGGRGCVRGTGRVRRAFGTRGIDSANDGLSRLSGAEAKRSSETHCVHEGKFRTLPVAVNSACSIQG